MDVYFISLYGYYIIKSFKKKTLGIIAFFLCSVSPLSKYYFFYFPWS